MRIVITTTPSGIGSAIAHRLLDGRREVVLLCSDREHMSSLEAKGAIAREGDLRDMTYVTEATLGADVLFWETPLPKDAPSLRTYQRQVARSIAEAVTSNGIPRVLNLSAMGAQHGEGFGPVSGLAEAEEILRGSGAHLVHLRVAHFMECFFLSLPGMKAEETIFLPLDLRTRVPMIAGRDVAEVASLLLRGPAWSGDRVIDLEGPSRPSMGEAALSISEGLGMPLAYERTDPRAFKISLAFLGYGEDVANQLTDYYAGLAEGLVTPEGQHGSPVRTETTLVEFARDELSGRMASSRNGCG